MKADHPKTGEQKDWTRVEMIVAGIDIGAVSAKAVILTDGQPFAHSEVRTRAPEESAFGAMNAALTDTGLGLENIHYIVATGRGRGRVPFAHGTISEIACAAAGAVRIWGPSVRTVLDAGGQSCRAVHCTEKGKATAFLWNDKCAAGIGRSIETFARLVGKGLTEIAGMALRSEKFPKLSDFCAVYAQSEALDLIRSKVAMEEVIAGYHHAMAMRIGTLAARSGVRKDFVVIGGLARNRGITDRLAGILEVSPLPPRPGWDPSLAVALGAAIFAEGFCRRRQPDTSK